MKDLTVINICYLLGVVQALFFSMLFVLKKKRSLVDTVAGLWLILFALQFTIILWLDISEKQAFLVSNIELLFTLLHGPFLYLYVKKLFFDQNSFKGKEFIHLLPFIFGLVFVLLIGNKSLTYIIPFIGIISGIAYILYSIFILTRFYSFPNLSVQTLKNIRWVQNLSIGLLIVWVLPLVAVNILRYIWLNIAPEMFYLSVPVFIFYLSFSGVNQQLIYTLPAQKDVIRACSAKNRRDTRAKAYMKSTLGNEEMKEIYLFLEKSMSEKKLYLNPDLSLQILSEALDLPQPYITQTLNICTNQNFNDFVNRFRIEEFTQRVRENNNRKFTLFGIANECGFHSKPTFNRVFKKSTGQTPSEYLDGLTS